MTLAPALAQRREPFRKTDISIWGQLLSVLMGELPMASELICAIVFVIGGMTELNEYSSTIDGLF